MPPTFQLRPISPIIVKPWFLPTSEIGKKHQELGGDSGWLGASASTVSNAPDVRGWYQHFQNGSIYWSPETKAHEVHGLIREKWASLGWETSFLGYPLTDELTTPDGRGRYNHFQGGSIYWTPQTGAWEVHGSILEKWASLGWETSFLGYPVSDETATVDGRGRFNNFERGQIAWSPQFGAAVSATSYEPSTNPGGLQLQGVGSNGLPEVRRRVVCSAYMDLTDDETFGSNERSSASRWGEVLVMNDMPQEVMKLIDGAGGEMRVELTLIGQARSNGDVLITGQALLYEGTSEQTNDLDGDEAINIIIPRDGFRSYSFRVVNENEGGDFADMNLTFSNTSA